MAKVPSNFVLETAPPSVITVHKRSPSQKKLDTIVEESSMGHLEAEVTNSFSTMGLDWSSGNGQAHSSYRRHGSSYVICAQ